MKITDIEQALRERPGDRQLWLDYAALLEERGDARGTLIRLEQRRDRLRPVDRVGVQQEIDELASAHRQAWDAALPDGATVLARRHGFATKVAVEWSDEDDAPMLVDRVLREPFVTALRISPTEDIEQAEVEAAGEQAWEAFDDGADAGQETDAPEPSIDPGALATLDFSRLSELGFPYLGLGALGAKALAASAFFRIGASGTGPTAGDTTGLLDSLDLRYSRIGNDGLSALAASPGFRGVRRLHLQHNRLTAKAARDLHRFTNLTELDLRYNTIGEEGAQALLAAPFIGSLRRLLLHRADISDAGAKLLADSPRLPPAIRSYWRNA
ncbi:hypothetical protein FZ103_23300 [Streptomonospora sp. PA3]|uniref:hypothetical protein n=1 Tax=Streptomonospora sp. PA3 TaxID=2607326 RepID=UPI0012DC81F6|nr:hypothetical protein [Streptomonospora sp. PA3]MUL44053.1 hypothetical protein [Streptomonospora sp. PA3]